MDIKFRIAVERDLDSITYIYNQAVETGQNTCDTKPFTSLQRKDWLLNNLNGNKTTVIIAEYGGKVIGYSYLSLYRGGRPAVSSVREISYYLNFDYIGKGIGSKLFNYTIEKAREFGITCLMAILMSSNTRSIKLLEKNGFEKWGEMPGIVQTKTGTFSHLYYGKKLT